MNILKSDFLWVSVFYFFILLCIALLVRDIPNQPDAFNVTLQQISDGVTELGDPASFATAALDFAKTGRISEANEWYYNLWPPGFIILEALIIKSIGLEAPIILVLQILAVSLFAIALMLLYGIIKVKVKAQALSIALPLLIFLFPVSRAFLLQPIGITLGETFAIGCFLICIFLAFHSVKRYSLSLAVSAGVCLALSAYIRSQFEFIMLVLTIWGILLAILSQLRHMKQSYGLNGLKPLVKTIVTILIVAHAATIPWRLYRWINFYNGSPSWVQSTTLYYRNSVLTSEYLESIGGDWLVAGMGNLVCRIDPSTCGETTNAKKLFFRTVIRHPVAWYSYKLDAIVGYWFSSVKNWSNVEFKPTLLDIVMNGLLLVALIALAILSFTRRVKSHRSWILIYWFNLSMFTAYALIFSLAHFEVRYFYFPKIFGIAMLQIVAIITCQNKSRYNSGIKGQTLIKDRQIVHL